MFSRANKACFYIFLITTLSLISCSEKKTYTIDQALASQFPLHFKSSQSLFSDKNVTAELQIHTRNQGDTLLLIVFIENNSPDSLKINPGELQIETSKHIRSDPFSYDLEKLNILPQSTDTLFFKFLPVNNLSLFNKIGLYGDLDSTYYVSFNFIHKGSQLLIGEKVKFKLDNNSYQMYKDIYAKEDSIILFEFENKADLKQQLVTHITGLNSQWKNRNGSNNVEVSSDIIMTEGAVTKLNFYYSGNDLFLQIKIVNHGFYELVINPEAFSLKINDKSISPEVLSVHNSINLNEMDKFHIIKSGRFETTLKYQNIDHKNIVLFANGLTYYDIKKEVFPMPIKFTTIIN